MHSSSGIFYASSWGLLFGFGCLRSFGYTNQILIITDLRSSRVRTLTHQGQRIVFRVAKEGHPQIVRVHSGYELWSLLKFHFPLRKSLGNFLNVLDIEVDDGAWVIKLRLFR